MQYSLIIRYLRGILYDVVLHLWINKNSKQEFIIHCNHETHHLCLRQCWIEKPTATDTKIMMMMNTPMTTVKIIPTELLLTVINVGISVYSIMVALSLKLKVESNVAKAVRWGDELIIILRVDMYSGELTSACTKEACTAAELWLIPDGKTLFAVLL